MQGVRTKTNEVLLVPDSKTTEHVVKNAHDIFIKINTPNNYKNPFI